MKKIFVLKHEFVMAIPEKLQEGTVYVSIDFATVAHKCCCGCGHEVVTPLSPTDWQLIFDGETVSLDPSVGNWNLPCQSHYFIRRNRVQWSRPWTREEIAAEKASNAVAKSRYYGDASAQPELLPPISLKPEVPGTDTNPTEQAGMGTQETRWQKLKRWLFGR